jgi:glycosyltransferase involved in cell wall biosynthesis
MAAVPLCPPARLSVVVPTRDRAPLLDECLASIRALEGPDLEIELLVVDDGSTDGSEEVARQHGATVLRTGGSGSAAARNAGMASATGEFLLFVDDDDVLLPGHVRPHIALLRERPGLMAAVGQAVNSSHDLAERGPAWPETLPEDGDLARAFFHYYPQIGATVARTCVRDTVAGQDPALVGDQDWDWHLRLGLRHRVGFVAQPCVLFRQRPPSLAQEAGEWTRLIYHRRVLWRNARRAGWRTLPPWEFAAILLRQRGAYAAAFAQYARSHAEQGDRPGAWRAAMRSLLASPPHAARAFLFDRTARSSLPWFFRRRRNAGRGSTPVADADRRLDEPAGGTG